MQIPLHITVRDIPSTDALETRIRSTAESIERRCPYLTGCKVNVEMPHKHKHQGMLVNVKIDMFVPKGELTVNRYASDDVYLAVHDAFEAADRRLEDYMNSENLDVKQHEQPMHGHVGRVFEYDGYGFIETDDGQEFYFSRDNVTDSGGFSKMKPGIEVQFIEGMSSEVLQAKRINMGKPNAP